jgi:hypothetical protein
MSEHQTGNSTTCCRPCSRFNVYAAHILTASVRGQPGGKGQLRFSSDRPVGPFAVDLAYGTLVRMWEAVGAIAGVASVILAFVGVRQARRRTPRTDDAGTESGPRRTEPIDGRGPRKLHWCEAYSRLFKIRCRKYLTRQCPIDGRYYCHRHYDVHTASHSRRDRRAAGIAT